MDEAARGNLIQLDNFIVLDISGQTRGILDRLGMAEKLFSLSLSELGQQVRILMDLDSRRALSDHKTPLARVVSAIFERLMA